MRQDKSGPRRPLRQGGRPRREESERKIALLLDKAAEIFAQEGYARTTMASLAASAAIGKPTIYAHFGSKPRLFSMVVNHILSHHVVAGDDVHAEDPELALKKQLSSILVGCFQPMFLRLFRLFLSEAHKFPEIYAAFNATSENSIRLLTPHLMRIGEHAKLKAPVRDVAVALLAMANNLVMMKTVQMERGHDIAPDDEADRIVRVVLYGLVERSARRGR